MPKKPSTKRSARQGEHSRRKVLDLPTKAVGRNAAESVKGGLIIIPKPTTNA
jgi:hypothetical protein